MNRIVSGLIVGMMTVWLSNVSILAAAKATDTRSVWPKNSQFTCVGILVRDDGTYRLTPDPRMLTWCDADIADAYKDRVLDACKLGNRCEIKGTIRGRGAFGWVEIASVKAIPNIHTKSSPK
jgi:hypothetical protein